MSSQAITRNDGTNHRKGYVLLMTLLLLMLVAAALTAACRTSLRQAVSAEEAERLLQERWAAITCQETLLPNCETVLAGQEHQTRQPAISSGKTIVLGGETIELIFCDESAKLNVPSLFNRSGRADAEIRLRQLLSGSGIANRVHLRPGLFSPQLAAGAQGRTVGLGSYGTILDNPEPADLLGSRYGGECPADRLSCWGDGRVNWNRASQETLRKTLVPPLTLTQVQKLITLRRVGIEGTRVTLDSALDACELNGSQRAAASDRLADGSDCHALWVKAMNGERSDYRLYVSEIPALGPEVVEFHW